MSESKKSETSIIALANSSKETKPVLPQNQTELVTNNKTESIKKNVTINTSGLININSASKEDFMSLPYIGEVKAERIIQLRNEMGVFTSIEDLEKVKGIGPKTLTKIEPQLTI
jgi:competence protein ComEA